jgi:CRP/FNR family transcriptional regulator
VLPAQRITINLAPADLKKEGSAFDLPMAVGILGASGCVRTQNLSEFLFMGELSLFSPSPLTDNGEALERTTVCMIAGEKIKELLKKYPSIAFKVMEELSKRLEKAENLIENIHLHGVEKRLADTLLTMADGNGEIALKMSKGDFASYMGMSQETLSRKLSNFQEMGLIELIGHRKIILLDIKALEEIE